MVSLKSIRPKTLTIGSSIGSYKSIQNVYLHIMKEIGIKIVKNKVDLAIDKKWENNIFLAQIVLTKPIIHVKQSIKT